MKSPEERSKQRLFHIIEAIDKIEEYINQISFSTFEKDSKCNEAVLFQLSIIGEAIIHVDEKILKKYSYPWHMVRAQRNMITHEYFGIRMDKIWSVLKNDLPELKTLINKIIEKEF